ncbi:nucleoside-diphosphate sugar epimerase/dehydratase [Sphingomonas sp. KR3-1]|uniref:nucleoside-diphosphate sugar epimerase/dehydratase n=1 Tax=Sphingomonas sp. KR3-1 TaxID=3156611 RepID=UPI0032B31506
MIEGLSKGILALPRVAKRAIAVGADAGMCALCVWIALYLRLGDWVSLQGAQWLAVVVSILLAIPIFIVSGLYRAIFRYSGSAALISLAQAAIVYGTLYASVITLVHIDSIPRTVGVIQPLLLFLFVAASRVMATWLLGDGYAQLRKSASRQAVLIYGAGSAGRQLHRGLAATPMRVVGFIDDNEDLHRQSLMGIRIYAPAEIEELVERLDVTCVLLAIPSASRRRRIEIIEMARQLGIAVRTIPGLDDVAAGRVEVSEIRELEIDDLLGRDAVAPDPELLERNTRGKVVLVTGAGGSIGSELCRQVLFSRPTSLLLVDSSEVALYSIHHELEARRRKSGDTVEIIPLLASVSDAARMRDIIEAWHPETIYHAAAYKHVPLVEHNPLEGMWNNVFGTLTVATAAREAGVPQFVLISTDKAVRPTNVMGATKRLAEQVLQAMATSSPGTCFSMVRFGNVLGSSGSVVPLFRRQIQAGGPVTITHPDITRYFMTIPEAAQLVIQAGAMAQGGEVFVLDMGEPVKIIDLARKIIELSGLKIRDSSSPDGDIELAFVGLRPGEKLYEELLIGNNPAFTSHPRIMKANEHFIAWEELSAQLAKLHASIAARDVLAAVSKLNELVPEFRPDNNLVDWVYRQAQSSLSEPGRLAGN